MARNKTRRELEYTKAKNPGSAKKEDRTCYLIIWVLVVMVFIGFVSKNQFSLSSEKEKVLVTNKDTGNTTIITSSSLSGNKSEEIVQNIHEAVKPFKIAAKDGSYEIWVMDAWYRQERYFT